MILLEIDENISFDKCCFLTDYVSVRRRKKINRFCFEKDKLLSLFAGLLVRFCVMKKYNIPNSSIEFEIGTHGKPFLADRNEYNFSVSHSGRCIAFAESDFPVGIDIEQIRDFDENIAKRYFSENERKHIENSSDFNKAFAEIWTSKEAYIKMTGDGLTVPLDSFCTVSGIPDYYFMHEKFSDCMVSVCLHESHRNEKTEIMNCYEIMDFFRRLKE